MRRLLFSLTALCALAWAGAAQAGTFALTGEDLSYVAPSGETNHVFLIHEEKPVRGFRLIDAGAPVTAGAGCSSVGPNEGFCPTPDSVDHVLVSVDDGDDYVNTSASSSSLTRLEGGNGNDALYSRPYSSATLDGGPGADVLAGEGATVDYSARTNPLTVTLGDGLANDGEAGENDLIANNVRSVLGGSGADTYTLTGTDALRLVDAGAGIDHLVAIGSNCGLFGGPGNDQIEAEHSHCGLSGGGDNDTIVGGDGRQFLDGGEGNDLLRAGPGPDSIAGEGGADEIVGGTGRDQMRGGSGDDTFRTKDGAEDFIDGNQGIDRAHADKGLDELHDIEQLF